MSRSHLEGTGTEVCSCLRAGRFRRPRPPSLRHGAAMPPSGGSARCRNVRVHHFPAVIPGVSGGTLKLFEVHRDETGAGKRAACAVNPRQVMTYATAGIFPKKGGSGTRGVVM